MRPPPLALLSGLLLALSFPPFPTSPLPFVALVPFAVHCVRLPAGTSNALQAGRAGFWLGVVSFGLLLHWVAFSLPGRPLQAVLAYAAVVALLALAPALSAWLLHSGVHRAKLPLWLVLPLAWTAVEWTRGHLPGGLAFPWAGTALALTGWPRALALLPWVGEHGVTLWVTLVNGLIAAAVLGWSASSSVRRTLPALAAGTAALPIVLLPMRGSVTAAAPLRVAVVQTAVPFEVRLDGGAGADAMAATVDRLLAPLEAGSVDLVVLPETAFPLPLEGPVGRVHLEALRRHAARLRAPVVAGAFGRSAGTPSRPLNSVYLVGPEGISGRYDKRRLVPVIERNPVAGSRALALLGDTTSYEAGAPRPPLRTTDVGIAALVCFESAFAGLARDQLRSGAGLLVNVTNDAWFGGGFPGTAARAQHEAHALLRAVESAVPVVRSSNGGRSLWIDPAGQVTAVAPSGREGVGVAVLTRAAPPGAGLWVHGAVGPASALVAALTLAIGIRRRRAELRASSPPAPVSEAGSG